MLCCLACIHTVHNLATAYICTRGVRCGIILCMRWEIRRIWKGKSGRRGTGIKRPSQYPGKTFFWYEPSVPVNGKQIYRLSKVVCYEPASKATGRKLHCDVFGLSPKYMGGNDTHRSVMHYIQHQKDIQNNIYLEDEVSLKV